MRQAFLGTTAALALILPALMTNATAQQKRNPGGPAPAAHAAPAPVQHFSAPVQHVAAPAQHFAAPVQHVAAPIQHLAAPSRAAPPHIATQQMARPNIVRQNAGIRQQQIQAHGNNLGPHNLAHRGGPTTPSVANSNRTITNHATRTVTGPNKTVPNSAVSKSATPNNPGTATSSKLGQGPENRGRNAANQQAQVKAQQQAQTQARARIYAAHTKPILHNPAFAGASTRDPATRALARSTFQGSFSQFRPRNGRDRFADRRGFHGIVLGWGGPVFWPYAYDDFVDYAFWPYGNDTFWPYAYDDVYDGIFGAYAPDATAYANVPAAVRSTMPRGVAIGPAAGATAQICSGQATGLTDWPIERIAQQVGPTDQQRTLLDQLKDATAQAVTLMQAACPTDLPSTPIGRLAAMHQRIESMLQALQLVGPALDKFYQSLSDEQKERFIAIEAEGAPKAPAKQQQPNLAQACGPAAQRVASIPINQIQQLLHPNNAQQAALDDLNTATMQAAGLLNENCSPTDQPLTPPGRVAAMEGRLNTMLKALNTVQPAMAKFYGSLTDEQKARFDRLAPRQG